MRSFCGFCGCRVDGTVYQFGVKWIRIKKCGHEPQFLGYILPPDVLKAKGWAKSMGDLPPDPAIERAKEARARERAIEEKEIREYEKRRQVLTRQRYI